MRVRGYVAIIGLILARSTAMAAEPLTVEQCITTLQGLNALNCVGQQLGGACPTDSKQYKLGAARYTVALDIAALTPVLTAAQKAQQAFIADLPKLDTPAPGKPDPDAAARQDQRTIMQNNWNAILAKECTTTPGHLKLNDLRLGDGPDNNAIPPSVLAAIAIILDK